MWTLLCVTGNPAALACTLSEPGASLCHCHQQRTLQWCSTDARRAVRPTVHSNPSSAIPGSCHLLSLILLLVLPVHSKLSAAFRSKQRVGDLPFLHCGRWCQQTSAWLGSACYSGLSLNVTSSGKHLGSRSILSATLFPCYTFLVAYLPFVALIA